VLFVRPPEKALPARELHQDAPEGPRVHARAEVLVAQKEFRASVPEGDDVGAPVAISLGGVDGANGPKVSQDNSQKTWEITKLRCEVLARGRVRLVRRGCDSEAWAAGEDIRRFDVAVEDAAVVHVAQPLEHGFGDELMLCWVQNGGVATNHLGQVRLVERVDEPEGTLHADHVEELHDVLVMGHRRKGKRPP